MRARDEGDMLPRESGRMNVSAFSTTGRRSDAGEMSRVLAPSEGDRGLGSQFAVAEMRLPWSAPLLERSRFSNERQMSDL